MNYELEIKKFKEMYNNGIIERAKCEERIKAFMAKREEILKSCADKGIQPEQLPDKINDSEFRLNELIEKANSLFGLDKQQEFNAAPF